MSRIMTQEDQKLLDLLKPGSVVYVGGACAEPQGILELIEAQGGQLHDIHYIQQPLGVVNKRDLSRLTRDSTHRTFFMTPFLRDGLKEGRVEFVPMHMRTIFDYLAQTTIDVALLQAARDVNGQLRFAPNVDYVDAVLQSADHLVIEENTSYLAPIGTPLVDQIGRAHV